MPSSSSSDLHLSISLDLIEALHWLGLRFSPCCLSPGPSRSILLSPPLPCLWKLSRPTSLLPCVSGPRWSPPRERTTPTPLRDPRVLSFAPCKDSAMSPDAHAPSSRGLICHAGAGAVAGTFLVSNFMGLLLFGEPDLIGTWKSWDWSWNCGWRGQLRFLESKTIPSDL